MNFTRESYHELWAGGTFIHPLQPRALWKLTGPDGERYLNGQVTNDIVKLPQNAALYAAVCNAKGRMEGDVFIGRHEEAFYLDAAFALRESLGSRLEKYLIADDAAFEDISDSWRLTHVFGSQPPTLTGPGFILPNMRYLLAGWDVWQPAESTLIDGWEIPAEWVETLRLELAIPTWGAELTETTLPPEAGLEARAIRYDKGCYVGQETIARIKSIGHVNRVLAQFQILGERAPALGAKIVAEGKEFGQITSVGKSPRAGYLALGYLARTQAEIGKSFHADDIAITVRTPISPS